MTTYQPHDTLMCNSRKKGCGDLAKIEPGPWGGEGYCRQAAGWGTPLTNEGRCKLHGGASLRGLQNPNYRHGRSSRYFPTRLFEEAARVYGDAGLRTLRLESELLAGRLVELLEGLPHRSGSQLWQQCLQAMQQAKHALDADDDDTLANALNRLSGLIETGAESIETWGSIMKVIEQRRKVVAVENKRTFREENTITHDQAMLLVHAVSQAVNEVLDRHRVDARARDEIADRLVQITHR